ncbi:MAG TPA: hypothetical protein PKB14_04200 [Rubrivivax sp.]|nr:hypothetical protein [Rubrivivax sp.]
MLPVLVLAQMAGIVLYPALPQRLRPPGHGSGLQWRALASIWTGRQVRACVLGCFGPMRELCTMRVRVPAILAASAVFHAMQHIKPRLCRPGVVANPRDTYGYHCGLRLARTTNSSVFLSAAQHGTLH